MMTPVCAPNATRFVVNSRGRGPQGTQGKGDWFRSRKIELCTGCRHGVELYQTKPLRQMHRDRRDQEDRCHWHAGTRHQRAETHGQAAEYLTKMLSHAHEMRHGHPKYLQKSRIPLKNSLEEHGGVWREKQSEGIEIGGW
jgi:hypothetical protein